MLPCCCDLQLIDRMIGLRASPLEEILGSDYFVHNIIHMGIGVEESVEFLSRYEKDIDSRPDPAGVNLGHVLHLRKLLEDQFDKKEDLTQKNMTRKPSFTWMDDENHAKTVKIHDHHIKSMVRSIKSSKAPRKSEGGGAFGGKISD